MQYEVGQQYEVQVIDIPRHHYRGAHLIVPKAKRSTEPGTPTGSASLQQEIEYLLKALKQ